MSEEQDRQPEPAGGDDKTEIIRKPDPAATDSSAGDAAATDASAAGDAATELTPAVPDSAAHDTVVADGIPRDGFAQDGVPQDATRVMPPADSAPAWAGRAEVPVPGTPPLRGGYETPAPPPPPSSGGRTWWTPLLLGLLALGLVAIVALAAWAMTRGGGDETPTASPTPSVVASSPVSKSPSAEPSLSPSASPEQLMQVPAGLVGLDQDEAAQRLQAVGLFWSFTYEASAKPANTVIRTNPGEGELVPAGSTVTLVVAIPQSVSPSVSPSPSASKKNN